MDLLGYIDVVNYPASENRPQQVDQNHPLPVTSSSSNSAPAYEKGAYGSTTDTIAQAVNAVSTTLAAFDCKDFQSISLQMVVLTAYTGTVAFQVSNDGTNWVTKTLVSANGGGLASSVAGTAAAVGTWQLYSGDIGARYFRVIQTAWTAGQVQVISDISALSTATIPQLITGVTLNAGTSKVGSVVSLPNHTGDVTATTVNAAGATYTSTVVDQGTDSQFYGSRVRVGVQHLAGLTHGHLTLEQSDDGTTYRETDRYPVPSDGYMHNFGFTLTSRYYRTKFINGSVAQTVFYHHSYRIGAEGPTPDSGNKTAFPLSTTALGASAAFTSPVFDLGANHSLTAIRTLARGDQAATLQVQQSRDNVNFYPTRPVEAGSGATISGKALAVPADLTSTEYGEWKILERYLRVVLTNTVATAMTATDLNAVLIP